MSSFRIESDSLGDVKVPNNRYWGAQTQRSVENFPIGSMRFQPEFLKAFALVKKAAAQANLSLGVLDHEKCDLICQVCDEIFSGALDEHFPLVVWQTGSGTHTNMNFNEVISNRAAEISKNPLGKKYPVHPNDHVNLSQSSNDIFPTAMHVATLLTVKARLLPTLSSLTKSIEAKSREFKSKIKTGRSSLKLGPRVFRLCFPAQLCSHFNHRILDRITQYCSRRNRRRNWTKRPRRIFKKDRGSYR